MSVIIRILTKLKGPVIPYSDVHQSHMSLPCISQSLLRKGRSLWPFSDLKTPSLTAGIYLNMMSADPGFPVL